MKKVTLAVSCLFCVGALGVVSSMILNVRQASHLPTASHANKVESIPAQNAAELLIPDDQTEVPADIALSDVLQFDSLKTSSPQLSIEKQQQVLSIVATASLDEITEAVANIPDDNNQLHKYHWLIRPMTQRWIELDPDCTLQEIIHFVSLQNSTPRDNLASDLLIENYAGMQPQSLIEWLGILSGNTDHVNELMVMYFALAESEPELVMELLTRNNALSSDGFSPPKIIFHAWSEEDPQAALQWLEQNGDEQLLDQHVESLISKLASRDPQAARTAAARYPGLFSEDEFVIQEIRILTESDHVAAMEMAQSLPKGNDRDSTINSILYAWSSRDLFAAFEYVESVADSSKRPMYVSSMSQSLASLSSQSPAKRQELLNWSESLSPESQMGVREAIVTEWAMSDPEAAIEWLNTHGGLSNYYLLVHSIVWSLPKRNMDMALDFYSSVYSSLDPESLMKLSKGIACTLYENNPQSAWSWYEELPENDAKQSILFALVMTTARENPLEALDNVYGVNSGDNVEMTIRAIKIIADEFDFPEEAENWLATANIDEQHATEIRAAIAQIQQDTNYGQIGPMINRGC